LLLFGDFCRRYDCHIENEDNAVIKILLIDDDADLAEMLKDYLQHEDFETIAVYDGESGVREALTGNYALAVLDVMLPGMRGTEVLNRIRLQSQMPVLMLTAKGDDVDRIVGLESGADDYVPKPCTPRELVARIRAILRRSGVGAVPRETRGPMVVGALYLWPEKRKAEYCGKPLELTSTEFSLLQVLASHCGRVVSKEELSSQGLGRPLARFDRTIDVHMSSIRQKLGHLPDGHTPIVTVRGKGYQLVEE
jgi:two-component system OmpR family response regulator